MLAKVGVEVSRREVEAGGAQVFHDVGSFLQEIVFHGLVVGSQESSNLGIVVAGAALQRRVVVVPSRVEVKQLVVGHRHAALGLCQLGTL